MSHCCLRTVLVGVCLLMTVPALGQLPRVGDTIDQNERLYFGFRSRGIQPTYYVVQPSDSLVLFGYMRNDSATAVDTVAFTPRQSERVVTYLENYETLALSDTAWYVRDTVYVRMSQNLAIMMPIPDNPTQVALSVFGQVMQGAVLARRNGVLVLSTSNMDSVVRHITERPYTVVEVAFVDSLSSVSGGHLRGWIPIGRDAATAEAILDELKLNPGYGEVVPPEIDQDTRGIAYVPAAQHLYITDLIDRVRKPRISGDFGVGTVLQFPEVQLRVKGGQALDRTTTSDGSGVGSLYYTANGAGYLDLDSRLDVGVGFSALFEASTASDSLDIGHIGFDSYQPFVEALFHLGTADRFGYTPLSFLLGARLGFAMTSVRWWTHYTIGETDAPFFDSAEFSFSQIMFGASARLYFWLTPSIGVHLGGFVEYRAGGGANDESWNTIEGGRIYQTTRSVTNTSTLSLAGSAGLALYL